MPKGSKTRKTALQRFKVTKSGKVFHKHARTSHLRSKESSSTRSRKKGNVEVSAHFKKTISKMIGV
jgi:ribosomal protein L35